MCVHLKNEIGNNNNVCNKKVFVILYIFIKYFIIKITFLSFAFDFYIYYFI